LEVAKSVVTLQVKPWDDETDMAAMEKEVRAIEKDGLVWGASKLVTVGYGRSAPLRIRKIKLMVECRYQDAPNRPGYRGQALARRASRGDPGDRGPCSVDRRCRSVILFPHLDYPIEVSHRVVDTSADERVLSHAKALSRLRSRSGSVDLAKCDAFHLVSSIS